jgi:3-hydroxyisobutyrate dehydrogenase
MDQLRTVVAEMAPVLDSSKTVLIHSSISPEGARELARSITAAGARVLDAPVSGSRPAAEAGSLTLMVGGEEETLAAARLIIGCYAEAVFHTGGVGTAQAIKLTNNVMLHMNHLIALEALRFAAAQGIDEVTAMQIVNVSTGRSWVTETWGLLDDMMTDHPQAGTEGIYAMMSKDMWQAVATARATLTPLPLTAAGAQLSKEYFKERESDLRKAATDREPPPRGPLRD